MSRIIASVFAAARRWDSGDIFSRSSRNGLAIIVPSDGALDLRAAASRDVGHTTDRRAVRIPHTSVAAGLVTADQQDRGAPRVECKENPVRPAQRGTAFFQ